MLFILNDEDNGLFTYIWLTNIWSGLCLNQELGGDT